MFPLVSILVPAYNVAQYLHKCLDSIVNQTYQQLQVVVVDDGSSDNSLSIVKDYAAKYPFVEVYHQENAGVAAARNNLLSHVKGDYVLFVDSDDWLELDMIEFLISKIEKYKVDVVTCGMVVNDTAVRKEYKQECWNQEVAIQKFYSIKNCQARCVINSSRRVYYTILYFIVEFPMGKMLFSVGSSSKI